MFHPGAARIDCEDCKKHVYDLDTGELQTYKSGPERTKLPLLRRGSPTPCDSCPKKSPEEAKAMMLTPQNWAAYRFWLEAKATGLTEEEKRDPIVRRNFAVLDSLAKAQETKTLTQSLAVEFIQILAQLKK